jgi:hypothetical protein
MGQKVNGKQRRRRKSAGGGESMAEGVTVAALVPVERISSVVNDGLYGYILPMETRLNGKKKRTQKLMEAVRNMAVDCSCCAGSSRNRYAVS